MARKKYRIKEISVEMKNRRGGVSSINFMRSVCYMLKICIFHYTEKFLGRGLYIDSSYQHWSSCHFSAPNFLLHKQTQAKGPLHAFLWMMIGLLGLATAIAIPLLNKLASKIGVAYMPATCVPHRDHCGA
ncbi:hypothetical protein P7H06_02385 [Paenibacillus larvae]|nr:hypothetical protein [Paenibacillus larvae]MDT2258649.1 hypothetical protein [Paenibacillus larvae]